MKILCINIKPDLSYFTQRGLPFDVTYETISLKFPLRYLYKVQDSDGSMVDMYTPDCGAYLAQRFGTSFQYSIILVGWNPSDYGPELKHTGGYTSPIQLNSGTRWCSVRQDTPVVNFYAIHEIHHALVAILNENLGNNHTTATTVRDFMDMTSVNGVMMPFYHNDDLNFIGGNYDMTWNQIKPYLSKLLAITYQSSMPTATLTRTPSTTKETTGTMVCVNGSQTLTLCTLELPDVHNLPNISCIPKGTYNVKWTHTLHFPLGVYQLQNVLGRSGIDIHVANYFYQLNGCIALGMNLIQLNGDGELDTSQSAIAVNKLVDFYGKKDFQLIIN